MTPARSLLDRLTTPGPKRLLALDGGGIRGMVTLGLLERVQSMLRERHGDPELRLSQYFDLIGGTSTGAIIAATLALGMDVSEVRDRYLQLGARVFGKRRLIPTSARFDAGPLEEELRRAFGDRRLDDPGIGTGLCIVTKRADTRSTWPLLNHPRGKYFEQNRSIPLWSAVRASAAAPGYFTPQMIDVGNGEQGLFVDGGVSMGNDPSLILFLVATLRGYPFRWPTGENRLLLLSVGTGTWHQAGVAETIANYHLWDWASEVPGMLIADAMAQTRMILQSISRSPTASEIDAELGDLGDDLLTSEPALHYLRYNAHLDEDALNALGFAELGVAVPELRKLQSAEHRELLLRIGRATAERVVRPDHFPAHFDLPD